MSEVQFKLVRVEKPDDVNMILGQSHFIKTVEDLYEAIVGSVPGAKFGLAFSESSGPCLVRKAGTDPELVDLAVKNMLSISAGHTFIILLRNLYPINVLNSIRNVPEVCNIYCATANPVEVIVAESGYGRGVVGVVDGQSPKGVEGNSEIEERRRFLRKIGYKL
ncbi:MAG: adenosine-specific kinase [Candidatus Bathyarchaeia archaeon]